MIYCHDCDADFNRVVILGVPRCPVCYGTVIDYMEEADA